jgi:hypothetical protein
MENVTAIENEEVVNRETSKIIAIFDTEESANNAYTALLDDAFTAETAETFCGYQGKVELDVKGEHHGLIENIKRKLHHFMLAESLQMDTYSNALKSGKCVVQVITDSRNWEKARDILKNNGGHFINFYGLFTTEVLEP